MHTFHWVPLELHALLPPGTGVSTGMHTSCKSKNWLFIWTLQNKDGTIQTCPDPLLFPKDYSVLTPAHMPTHIPRVTCCRHSGNKINIVCPSMNRQEGKLSQRRWAVLMWLLIGYWQGGHKTMVKLHDGWEDIFEPRPEDLRDKGEEQEPQFWERKGGSDRSRVNHEKMARA